MMNNPRYDIYALIHKGLRACLTDALIAMGQVDLSSATETTVVLDQIGSLLSICRSHLAHENEFIHPAMEAKEPGIAADMYHHHEQHKAMIDELQALVLSVADSESGSRIDMAAQLYRKLALFVADNLNHMHEEETSNNVVLWRHYSDAEIQDIEHRLVQSIAPQQHDLIMRWMLTAINHQEREGLLMGMRHGAPEPVFNGVLSIAKLNLPRPEWKKLELAFAG